jgi:hypothetical protein
VCPAYSCDEIPGLFSVWIVEQRRAVGGPASQNIGRSWEERQNVVLDDSKYPMLGALLSLANGYQFLATFLISLNILRHVYI